MHRESSAIQHLPIYLSNEHYVNFHAHQTVNKVVARQNVEKTQLTAWFDYNSVHDDGLCHDLAKRLSHYLYFFFFFSFSFLLSWTYYTEGSAGKHHITSVTQPQSHDRKSQHHIT